MFRGNGFSPGFWKARPFRTSLSALPARPRKTKTWPDAAYGTTIRIYHPGKRAWDIFYGTAGETVQLEAKKENGQIVLTEITQKNMKWIFSDITDHTFHWKNIHTPDGKNWLVGGEAFATRRQ